MRGSPPLLKDFIFVIRACRRLLELASQVQSRKTIAQE
jgi:hypothetical protein